MQHKNTQESLLNRAQQYVEYMQLKCKLPIKLEDLDDMHEK